MGAGKHHERAGQPYSRWPGQLHRRRRALDSLQTARRVAPQLTRYHPQVHETVSVLATQDARTTRSLPHFAAWCGIRI